MGGDGVVAGEAPRGPIHSLAFLQLPLGRHCVRVWQESLFPLIIL